MKKVPHFLNTVMGFGQITAEVPPCIQSFLQQHSHFSDDASTFPTGSAVNPLAPLIHKPISYISLL